MNMFVNLFPKEFNVAAHFVLILMLSIVCPSKSAFSQFDSESEDYRGSSSAVRNPLVSYGEQLSELKRQCNATPFDPECIRRKRELKAQISETKLRCKEDPGLAECQSLRSGRGTNRNIERREFCQRNPNDSACRRAQERSKKQFMRRADFCSKNPLSPKCQTKTRKSYNEMLIEHCRQYPAEKRCAKISKQYGFRPEPSGPQVIPEQF